MEQNNLTIAKMDVRPNVSDIEAVIHQWVQFLVEENYVAAFQYTVHDPYYKWTPELIASVIKGYGLPYEEPWLKFRVTAPHLAIGNCSNPNPEINGFSDPYLHRNNEGGFVIGEVRYELPLNGAWSDLTVTFAIIAMDDYSTLELNEIHVF